eukprot:CAMPEP_0113609804 /NCGR_PEP_ID=MMETSP0017_2-20120614/4688_1 /TAXON_ID=2856 /ORGANISM="Cylindrotheca closterium" /LENGTH=443 /DNA_ID=CAMNT_0000518649 /DNA_START=96 /DNA_END=1427 /DNA_ORIENTATION=- /assembly_acc=CAM_ASM_000147
MKQRTSDVHVLSETDEETPASPTLSPTQSADSKERTSMDSAPFSAEQAAKAAYAIMNGESITEVDMLKDDSLSDIDVLKSDSMSDVDLNKGGSSMYEVELKDEPSPIDANNTGLSSSNNPRISLGGASTQSAMSCDNRSVSTDGSAGRRGVRILRTPDGRRINRRRVKEQVKEQSENLEIDPLDASRRSTDTAISAISAMSDAPNAAPPSPGGSLRSSPERPVQDDERTANSRRSGSSGVRILRTPDGRRVKRNVPGQVVAVATRHSFAGVVTTITTENPVSPQNATSSNTRRVVSTPASFPKAPKIVNYDADKEVSFSSINFRYYERVVDVNPACSSGVAIGMGWNYNKSKKISVNEYELQKGGVRYNARQLVLPRNVREDIAREFGYRQKDIAKGTRANLKMRNERKQTIDNLAMMPVEERVEGAKRKLKKVFSFRRKRVS